MKKKKEIKNENDDKIIDMEKVSFSEVGKTFWNPEQKEDQKDEISQYADVLPEVKRALLESLKRVDEIVKPTSGGFSRKTRGLSIAAEQSKQYSRDNSARLEPKYEIDERTGEVLKKKSKIVRPITIDEDELSK